MIRAIVTDIEGTTSSLSFVKDVLFPYARAHLGDFIRSHRDETQVAEQLTAVSAEAGRPLDEAAAIDQLIRWIDEDRKITPLKTLQGMIWRHGYETGEFQGHVYDDAVTALRRWHAQGLRLYVYSSGSVPAQKLLFGYTAYGDLTPLFSGYFDTAIGQKKETASYKRIAEAIALPPAEILFLSDIVEELNAARAAGFRTGWLVRDAATPATGDHPPLRDFNAVSLA